MKYIQCGDNIINVFSDTLKSSVTFSSASYSYQCVSLSSDEEYLIDKFQSAIVLLLSGDLSLNDLCINQVDELLILENSKVVLKSNSENTIFLLVGTEKVTTSAPSIVRSKISLQKKVEKPWGYEIWITGEHASYCFKKIYIKAGFKTSLQFHNYKTETNLLFAGKANLYYKTSQNIDNLEVTSADIGKIELNAISSIDVKPGTLHRLEALSDIYLYEVSTPEVDDVIRVSDDSNRPSGRIVSEHKHAK